MNFLFVLPYAICYRIDRWTLSWYILYQFFHMLCVKSSVDFGFYKFLANWKPNANDYGKRIASISYQLESLDLKAKHNFTEWSDHNWLSIHDFHVLSDFKSFFYFLSVSPSLKYLDWQQKEEIEPHPHLYFTNCLVSRVRSNCEGRCSSGSSVQLDWTRTQWNKIIIPSMSLWYSPLCHVDECWMTLKFALIPSLPFQLLMVLWSSLGGPWLHASVRPMLHESMFCMTVQ